MMAMTTVVTPTRMTRCELVRDLLAEVPAEIVDEIRLVFDSDQSPTTSFVDELVRQLLAENRARRVVCERADAYTIELAELAARRYQVAERLTFE